MLKKVYELASFEDIFVINWILRYDKQEKANEDGGDVVVNVGFIAFISKKPCPTPRTDDFKSGLPPLTLRMDEMDCGIAEAIVVPTV